MKKTSRKYLLGILLMISPYAYADQCAWISQQQMSNALDVIKPGSTIVHFCEPCGDKNFHAQTSEVVNEILVGKAPSTDKTYWTIKLNNKNTDLAYVFLKTSDNAYVNVSKLANCPSDSVSIGFEAKTKKKGAGFIGK